MKRKIISIINLFIIILSSLCMILPQDNNITYAADATSSTYAKDIRSSYLSVTQDAYLPEKAIVGIGLSTPSDIFIDSRNNIYICDTKNKNVVLYDNQTKKIIYTLTYNGFKSPKGIWLLNDTLLYVADSSANKVFVFEKNEVTNDFNYLKEFGKPTSPLFENQEFKPAKIAVDRSKNMFIIGESVLEGIIQLSDDGTFLGYFSSNKVNKTLKEKMQELIYDDEILDLLGSTQPPAFNNVYVDNHGLVYSTTSYALNSNYDRIKKHNTSGKNIINALCVGYTPIDIYVGNNNVIYVAWSNGRISTYTEDGEILFSFAGSSNDDIAGLFSSISSLAVDSNNNIYAIDDKKAAIHKFVPTEYTNLIFEALALYQQRNYKDSISKWEQVLALNQVSAIAHYEIGLNYLYSQEYQKAMEHLKLVNDKENYSQAFWEVRNSWLQANMVIIVFVLIALLLFLFICQQLKIRKQIVVGGKLIEKVNNIKLVKDMKFNTSILTHPYDNFYYLRTNKKGSTLSCVITMFLIFIIFFWSIIGKGYIFRTTTADDIDILALIFGYFGIIFLLTFCNWLVSSIQDGEGTFMAIFRMVVVSLIPYAISLIVVTLLSYVATTNEVFILQLIQYVGIVLSLLTLFLGIMNVHFYTFKKTIISILLTVLLIFVIILVALLIIILSTKLWQFIEVLLKEVFR